MKRISIQTGGLLPDNDLFMHVQNGAHESLKALVEAFGIGATESFKLHGVEVTLSGSGGTTATWTAGAIVLDGEICLVDAGTVNRTLSQDFRFAFSDSWGASDYITGGPQNTRLTRKATIVAGTAVIPVTTMQYDAPYLSEVIAGLVVNTDSSSGAFGASGGASWTVDEADVVINYSKAINGLVTLNFAVNDSSVTGTTSWLSWTLPGAISPVLYEAHGMCQVNDIPARFELLEAGTVMKIYLLDGSAMPSTAIVRGTVQFYV
jgi:hypothetical protein